jgi:predicted oxidoreductase
VEETIEALEKAVGFPESTLTATVAYFNRHAAGGLDPLFRKAPKYLRPLSSPPYSALDLRVGKSIVPGFTLGGLETLVDGEVVTPDGRPIPGLFAAGRTTAGLPHSASGYASGLSIADGSFFGRRAGRAAAGAKAW